MRRTSVKLKRIHFFAKTLTGNDTWFPRCFNIASMNTRIFIYSNNIHDLNNFNNWSL